MKLFEIYKFRTNSSIRRRNKTIAVEELHRGGRSGVVGDSDPQGHSELWTSHLPHHLHLSRSLADRWGTTVDFTTNFLHSSQFSAFHSMLFHPDRLVGLVVKASASRAEEPGSNPVCAGIFSGTNHTSDLKIGTPVATLPGAWRYRVSAGTGWPGVSIL